ncbi:GNAT family N-acetyltransferase [Comamonas sp. MYb69]|uniref:GNAT family N-acetyltransferase n=1 Tax=Comamonas sp. MYb69 TaxID=1848650 RepID=UPI0030ABACE1
MQQLPPFPGSQQAPPQPAAWVVHGLSLRHACDEDLPWLQMLYSQSREAELAPVPWPPAVKAAFLESQFALQHRHFVQGGTSDAWWIVCQKNADGMVQAIGRLYLAQGAHTVTVVDICLLGAYQSQGLGSALLRHVLADAAQAGKAVSLHVAHGNTGALQLYQRLGFSVQEDMGSHLRMQWLRPAAGAALR